MRSATSGWLISITALAAAIAIRWLLDPVLGDSLPLVTTFAAVAAAVWVGGIRPAILATLVGYLLCAYLFIEPRGEIGLGAANVVGLIAYLFTCALIISFGDAARRAKNDANERRELLRVTLHSIGDGVITTDVAGRVTYLNPVAESLTGWTKFEAIGKPLEQVFRILNEDSRHTVENPAVRALRDGVIVGLANHTVLIRKNGEERGIDDSAAPIMDEEGDVAGCVLIFRDVTEHRQAERARAVQLQTARLLAAIVESSDDAIVSKSLDGIIQSWNTGAERIFGHKAADAIGEHISLIIPPDRIDEEERIVGILREGRRIEHFETQRVTADGRRLDVSLTISPLKNEAGEVIGASKIARDISARKQAEAERERMSEALQKLAEDLAEADRRKNEFLAILAHELRNPLAPISNTIQAIRLQKDTSALDASIGLLERQVVQMSRLVDDLLDLSRISRGKIELRRERVDLIPIVEQVVDAARAMNKTTQHELTVDLPAKPIYLDADPTRIAQIIGNLMSNACKFTDPHGRVRLTVQEADGEVMIAVQDNGIGIAADQIPRLFEMFVQVDTSLHRSRDGLGIGLTLVKTLVDMHGGTINVSSEGLGQGSTFTVRLPTVADAPRAADIPTSAPAQGPAHRVLVVDDNVDGAESLAMLLKLSGHDTRVSHDGPEAIAIAEQFRPDAILLDIGLPRMSGYEVARRIRSEPWGRNALLIAVTGWGQDDDRTRSIDAGFDIHFVKPVDHAALMAALALR